MRLEIDPVVNIAETNLEILAWGMTGDGAPCFQVRCGGRRVVVEMTPEQARDFGCGAIVAASQTAQLRQTRQATARNGMM